MNVYSELKNAQLENLSSDPAVASGAKGRIYHKSTTEPIKIDDGANIHTVVTDQNKASHITAAFTMPIVNKVAILRDQKASNANGGSATSGAVHTRTLNTEQDPSGIVTLASNQFTLAAGTYLIEASAPGYRVGSHKAAIFNTGDSSYVWGSTEFSFNSDAVQSRSQVSCILTLGSSQTYELRQWCQVAQATDGLGRGSTSILSGDYEVFSIVKITQIAT